MALRFTSPPAGPPTSCLALVRSEAPFCRCPHGCVVRSPWAVGRKPGVADTSPLSPPLPGTPCRRLLTLLSLAAFSNEKTAQRLLSHLWTGPLRESIPPPGLWVSHSCPSPGKVLLSSASPCRFSVLLGNIQAVALRDIFVQAQNRDSLPPSLQIEEPEWEKRRSVNLSELIDVYRWAAVWSCRGETCPSPRTPGVSVSGGLAGTWAEVWGENGAWPSQTTSRSGCRELEVLFS